MIDNPFMLHEFLLRNAVSLQHLRSSDQRLTLNIADVLTAFKLRYKMMEDQHFERKPESLQEVITLIDRKQFDRIKEIAEIASDVKSKRYHLEFLMNSVLNVDELGDEDSDIKYLEMKNLINVATIIEYLPHMLWYKFNIGSKQTELYKTYRDFTSLDLQKEGFNWESIGY
ncbi:MAG: hypothetical protein ABJN36_19310 [Cyclobacteriaceae bacterium]|uniref:hypothetical protein n=1 Tax=Reichenbachiella sp. TaxID=2184521 RepID=UPI0032679BB2